MNEQVGLWSGLSIACYPTFLQHKVGYSLRHKACGIAENRRELCYRWSLDSPFPESEINSPWSTVTPSPGKRSFRDYILVHPAGTFDPIYVYLSKNPNDPIWTKTKTSEPVENAYGHWMKHGHEFEDNSFNNSKEYVDATHDFVRTPLAGTLTKVRQNGDVMYYHPASNTFSVKTKDGVPKTMFKPKGGMEHWEKQK